MLQNIIKVKKNTFSITSLYYSFLFYLYISLSLFTIHHSQLNLYILLEFFIKSFIKIINCWTIYPFDISKIWLVQISILKSFHNNLLDGFYTYKESNKGIIISIKKSNVEFTYHILKTLKVYDDEVLSEFVVFWNCQIK